MANEYDSPWKEAIGLHFRQFLEFFFPEIAADIDWSAGYEFLDAELQAITRGARHGRRVVDRLVKVTRLSGKQQLVLIHIEIQSQVDRTFSRRMLLYYTRVHDLFGLDLCSLAILGDSDPNWRPSGYRYGLWGCVHRLRFPVRKLLDYPDWVSQSDNPFAWLTAAHLQALATRRKPKKRAEIKFRLIRGLYSCGFSGPQVRELFRLLDWVLALPRDLEYAFKQDLARFEEENLMPYVTSVERIARKEGLQEGLQEACNRLRVQILQQYQSRWGRPATEVAESLELVQDIDRLAEILTLTVTAKSREDWSV